MNISAFRPLGNRVFSDAECHKIIFSCRFELIELRYAVVIRISSSYKPGFKKYRTGYYNFFTERNLQFDSDFDNFIRDCLNTGHFDPLDVDYQTKSILQLEADDRDYSYSRLFALLDRF